MTTIFSRPQCINLPSSVEAAENITSSSSFKVKDSRGRLRWAYAYRFMTSPPVLLQHQAFYYYHTTLFAQT